MRGAAVRAAIFRGPGEVGVDDVVDAALQASTDAVVRTVRSSICGSDLWSYRGIIPRAAGARLGHEFIGVVEEVGEEVRSLRRGDFVIVPFQWSDNACGACRDGFQTSCDNGGTFAAPGADGGQGEAVRVPYADGTCVVVPDGARLDDGRLASMLALTDVAATGLHGAVLSGVQRGGSVVVIGDGAVGLNAVLGARAVIGAERVVLVSTHPDRAALGREFGATDIVDARGDTGVERIRELFGGRGAEHVVEAVGNPDAWDMAVAALRPGGTVGAVGVPHVRPELSLFPLLVDNLTVRVGLAPARRYLPQLVERVLAGGYEPGRVFDQTLPLERVRDGYDAMSDRRSVKVMLAG
jgi:threonine dehydrogenase-like Zn-dependent dehydrogenase